MYINRAVSARQCRVSVLHLLLSSKVSLSEEDFYPLPLHTSTPAYLYFPVSHGMILQQAFCLVIYALNVRRPSMPCIALFLAGRLHYWLLVTFILFTTGFRVISQLALSHGYYNLRLLSILLICLAWAYTYLIS